MGKTRSISMLAVGRSKETTMSVRNPNQPSSSNKTLKQKRQNGIDL
jgi:hypothetical protein